MFPLSFLTEPLFYMMVEPVGQCAFGLSAQSQNRWTKACNGLVMPTWHFSPLYVMSWTPLSWGNCVWPSHRPLPPLAFMLMTMAFLNGLLAFLWSAFVSYHKWTCPPPPPPFQKNKFTSRLQALDVPRSLQEVVSQKQEDNKKRKNRNKDPGDDDGSYCNHSEDLEKYLGQKEKCEHNINQRATQSKTPLLLCGLPVGQWGLFLKAEQEKLFQSYLCEAITDLQ